MGIGFQYFIAKQRIGRVVNAEVNKRFVDNQSDTSFFAPLGQSQHISFRNEITGRIVRVDKHQRFDVLVSKEVHQVVGRIAVVFVLRNKSHLAILIETVWIFFEGGTDEACLTLCALHQHLDEFRGSVARNDVVFADIPALTGNQRVHLHA